MKKKLGKAKLGNTARRYRLAAAAAATGAGGRGGGPRTMRFGGRHLAAIFFSLLTGSLFIHERRRGTYRRDASSSGQRTGVESLGRC